MSKGRVTPRPTRSPILQTVKISQSRTAVAAGELFVVEEKKPELLAAQAVGDGCLDFEILHRLKNRRTEPPIRPAAF